MASGQQIAFEPTLTQMLAQHLHDPAIWRNMIVAWDYALDQAAILDLEDVAKPVGIGFVGTKKTEVLLLLILGKHVAQHFAKLAGRFMMLAARFLDRDGILRKSWYFKSHQQLTAVGMWIGSHAPLFLGSKLGQFR